MICGWCGKIYEYDEGKAVDSEEIKCYECVAMEGVKCLECGKYFKKINNSHLKSHGMTKEKYTKKHKSKVCSKCRIQKPISEFYKNCARADGFKAYCKSCAFDTDREWREKNPEKYKQITKTSYDRHMTPERRFNYKLRHQYNLSREEFDDIYNNQQGKCKLCKKPVTAQREAHVDHNHDNGKIRGILCGKCNLGLGHFYDNPEVLLKASEYIIREGKI